MTEILADYVAHTRQLSEMKSQLLMALSYPLILLAFASLAFLSILIWIIPSFESIYMDFQIELPAVTLKLFQASFFFTDSMVVVSPGRHSHHCRLPVVYQNRVWSGVDTKTDLSLTTGRGLIKWHHRFPFFSFAGFAGG